LRLPETIWRSLNEFLAPDNKKARLAAFIVFLWAGLGNLWLRRKSGESLKTLTLSPVLKLCLFWMVVLIGGQIIIDLLKQSHTLTIRRYLLLVSPAYYLLIAYALLYLPPLKPQWIRAAVIGGILAMILTTPAKTTSSDEFKQAAFYINDYEHSKMAMGRYCKTPQFSGHWIEYIHVRCDRPTWILINKSGAIAVGMAYYFDKSLWMPNMLGLHVQSQDDLKPHGRIIRNLEKLIKGPSLRLQAKVNGLRMHSPDRVNTENWPKWAIEKQKSQEGLIPRNQRIWMVYSHEAPSTRNAINAWFEKRGFIKEIERNFPGVQVNLFVRSGLERAEETCKGDIQRCYKNRTESGWY
jgi:hypothetical protein